MRASPAYDQQKVFDVSNRIRKKLVIVGDGATGKTALLMVQALKPFPEIYVPTIFESYISRIPVKKQLVELNLWDTAGQEDYDRLRPLSYPDTDVIIIATSVVDMESYYNITERWYPETRHFLPNAPVLLVGTKIDLRPSPDPFSGDWSRNVVTPTMGAEMAKQIGANGYMECSAKEGKGIVEIFQKAAKMSLKGNRASRRGRSECKIL